MLEESCGDVLVNKNKTSELEQNDDLNSHKAKAARTIETENLSVDSSEVIKNAVSNTSNQTEESQT